MKKTVKATIIDLMVALFIDIIIIIAIHYCFGQTISNMIQLVNQVAITVENQKQEKPTTLNIEKKQLRNYPEYGLQYATISIPKIDINLPVYFGDTLEILKNGVGHSSGSYFPGEGGSIIYMGHNSKKIFRRFSELQIGNEIKITTTYGEFQYVIYDMQIIEETEVDKLPIQKEQEKLMIYTCYPFNNIGYTTKRYVVYAEPIL